MRPQLQSTAPPGGFGDCHRTCIAMILDMDRDDVPHFMADVSPGLAADHPLSIAAEQAERDWLAGLGLTIVNVPLEGSAPLGDVLASLGTWAHDAAVILGGRTERGVCHSVVFHRGRVYDPRRSEGCTLVGPQPSGYWYVTIYTRATKPLPAEPAPGNVVTEETD